MLDKLSPIQARLLVLALALACLWSLFEASRPDPVSTAPAGTYSDLKLYREIAEAVEAGTPYHRAARDLQHQHDFPTQPFVTVRLPTLALLAATFGWSALQAAAAVLVLLTTALWYRLAAARGAGGEALGVAFAVLVGAAMVSQRDFIALHDLWAGLLTAAALALRGGKQWLLAVLLAGMALAIRELALPFVALALIFAAIERRRGEALGWLALLALFTIGYWLHMNAVQAVVQPGDKQSMAWSDLRGAGAVLRDFSQVSLIAMVPRWLAFLAVPLALFGWTAAPRHTALFGLLYCTGMAAMIALFSRPDNFYWACLLLPAWFIGLAFLPRALRDLMQAALARRGSRL